MSTPTSPMRVRLDPSQLQCRFYEKKFPDVEELVMVNVKSIAEMVRSCLPGRHCAPRWWLSP